VTAGVGTLIWCAVLVADAVIAQQTARRSLEAKTARRSLEASGVVESTVSPPAGTPATDVAPARAKPIQGAAVATLSIPRVRLSAVVLHGSDERTLRRGPGHLEKTALPGESGNVVIAGHRDTFFRPLRNVALGDHIFLETPEGQFHYRVTSLEVVNPRDVSVLATTDENVLTLITCFPFWVLGNAPDRFVVRAAAVERFDASPAGRAVFDDEPAQTPAFQEPLPARSPSDAAAAPAIVDDRLLVRQAIERFRMAYNARLAAEAVPAAGWLHFASCDEVLTRDASTVTCVTSRDAHPRERTFSLERTPGGWAIKAIVVR
jgi:sortase A